MYRCFILAIALAFLCLAPARAQEADEPEVGLEAGDWALQFRITNNFTLSSFQGATLSAKYHTAPNRAWRVGVLLDGGVDDSDVVETDFFETIFSNQPERNATREIVELSGGDGTSYNLGIEAQYVFYPGEPQRTMLFWGVGPALAFSGSDRQRDFLQLLDTSDTQQEIQTDEQAWSQRYGIGGMIGVEWFATPRVSLSAEYHTVVDYARGKDTVDIVSQVNPDDPAVNPIRISSIRRTERTSGWTLQSGSVRFGLSVYL